MKTNTLPRTRGIWLVFTLTALAMFLAITVQATPSHRFEGIVQSVGEQTLAMMVGEGEMTFAVAPEAVISLDGNAAALDDLKPGFHATVTAEQLDDGMMLAMAIDARTASVVGR